MKLQLRIKGKEKQINSDFARSLKIEYMFDIRAVKCSYDCRERATDRRLALIYLLVKNDRPSLSGQGGYFCALIIALRSNGITKSKASNT